MQINGPVPMMTGHHYQAETLALLALADSECALLERVRELEHDNEALRFALCRAIDALREHTLASDGLRRQLTAIREEFRRYRQAQVQSKKAAA